MEATDLPTLTGTEKQIAWATEIRQSVLDGLDAQVARYRNDVAKIEGRGLTGPIVAKTAQHLEDSISALAKARTITRADYWIACHGRNSDPANSFYADWCRANGR